MTRFRSGEDDKGSLRRRYMQLQREWNSYKQSAPPRLQRGFPTARSPAAVALSTPKQMAELFDSSPKQLLSSPQEDEDGSPTEVWGVRSVDWDAEKIVLEKKAVTPNSGGGGLRGRSLLEALESARDHDAEAGEPGKTAVPVQIIPGDGWDRPLMCWSSCGCSCSGCSNSSSLSSDVIVKHVGARRGCPSSPSLSLERAEGEKTILDATTGDEDSGVACVGERRPAVDNPWLAAMLLIMLSVGVVVLLIMGLYGDEGGCCLIPT